MSRVSNHDEGLIGGIDFIEALALLFIGLKLTGFLPAWTWLWVLSPLWITFSIALVIAIIVIAVDGIDDKYEDEDKCDTSECINSTSGRCECTDD